MKKNIDKQNNLRHQVHVKWPFVLNFLAVPGLFLLRVLSQQ